MKKKLDLSDSQKTVSEKGTSDSLAEQIAQALRGAYREAGNRLPREFDS